MKGLTTIPFYECHNGAWQTDTGDGKKFTKSDVKKIYADDSRHCVIVLLKDGTEINPDFTATMDGNRKYWDKKARSHQKQNLGNNMSFMELHGTGNPLKSEKRVQNLQDTQLIMFDSEPTDWN